MKRGALLFLSLGAIAALGLGVSIFSCDSVRAQTVSLREPASAIANRVNVPLPSGEVLFEKRCSNCHELDEHDRGPALRDVYGRDAGHKAGFRFSQALSSRYFNWDETNLNIWLQGPGRMIPGTRMRVHVAVPAERAAIIAYLKSISPSSSSSEQSQ